MKKAINVLLLVSFVFSVQRTSAQKKDIKSNADLPVLTFSTATLQTADTNSVNTWLKNIAIIELPHIDSILNSYTISNPNIKLDMMVAKSCFNLIAGNWDNLQYEDTLFKQIVELPDYWRRAGPIEFATYAKVKLQSPADVSKYYISILKKSLEPFSLADKNNTVNNINSRSFYFSKIYDDEMKKIKSLPVVGDTSLKNLINGYAYKHLKLMTGNSLFVYTNDLVAEKFTKADTLRGAINEERAWWNVLRYDITLQPDQVSKTISGKNLLQYKVVNDHYSIMQIDLQDPLIIDSIIFNAAKKLSFIKEGNAWHVTVPQQKKDAVNKLLIYYHGKVQEAINPPWEGGFTWTKDSLGNAWMEITCQGKGASVWFPCKDHQSDEPDNGASLSVIVPDSLIAVANGRLQSTTKNNDGTTTYKWAVVNPINNYDIIPYIGKYVHFSDEYDGEKGKLDLNFWVLNYNLQRAKAYLIPEVKKMLKAHEYWFGPYPFYEDSYKLVEAPAGMEHQSNIAYSNGYHFGEEQGDDLSESGWGMKWDYIIVHESGHEWFGNNITTKDIADMWVHEGITCYSETLYTEYWYGKEAGNEYNYGLRKEIQNNFPVIGYYGVNDELFMRSGDMYDKGANMLHTIRHSMDNDSAFRLILRGLNKTFYHQTVTTAQIENYISKQSGYDYSKVFNQYLRTIEIPQLEFYFSSDKKNIFYRYTNCIDGFNLPLVLKNDAVKIKIIPTTQWKNMPVTAAEAVLFNAVSIEKMYYLNVTEVMKQ